MIRDKENTGGHILWQKKECTGIKFGHKKGDLLRLAAGKRRSGYGSIVILKTSFYELAVGKR